MKTGVWKPMAAAALVCAAILAGTAVSSLARARKGEKLEGTWLVQVTIRDCQTSAELGPPFASLLSFAAGGTLTETTSRFSPALRGPSHGLWERTGANTYRAVSYAFLYGPDGTWTGTQKLTQTIVLGDDRNVFEADASNEIADANGNVVLTGCSTAIGHRLE
jgi:hypothetical protein